MKKTESRNSQIRTEINQIILKLPENQLKPILDYLRQIEQTTAEQSETAKFINKIFEEDGEFFKKIAK